MGHKLSKIPSESLDEDGQARAIHAPASISTPSPVSTANDMVVPAVSMSGQAPTSSTTSTIPVVSSPPVREALTSLVTSGCQPPEAAPSLDNLNTLSIIPTTCKDKLVDSQSSSDKTNAYQDYVGPGRSNIDETRCALVAQILQLPSLPPKEILEEKGDETLRQAVMQLCECQSTR